MPCAFPVWVPTPRNDLIGSARYADAGQPLTERKKRGGRPNRMLSAPALSLRRKRRLTKEKDRSIAALCNSFFRLLSGKSFSASGSAVCKDFSAVSSAHSLTESMHLAALTFLRLIGSKHDYAPPFKNLNTGTGTGPNLRAHAAACIHTVKHKYYNCFRMVCQYIFVFSSAFFPVFYEKQGKTQTFPGNRPNVVAFRLNRPIFCCAPKSFVFSF
jgi:hypothetical protein